MKFDSYSGTYALTAQSIDRISEQVESFLASIQTEHANILRIRLSLEEALLRWQDKFGEDTEVLFSAGSSWRRPTITLKLTGESFDPMEDAENDMGGWIEGLLSEVGLTPRYSYRQGVNILQLRLPRPQRNPALNLLISVAAGLIAGLGGRAVLPEILRERLIHTILGPLQGLMFRILNAAAGPVIFFTVLVGICGVGSIAVSRKASRKILLRFISATSILTVLTLVLSIKAFSLHYFNVPMSDTRFASFLDFFLQIIPNDILSPIITGDTPQVILIAIILGNALLVVDSQTDTVISLIEQLNKVGLIIADWVGTLSPCFALVLLILDLWDSDQEASSLLNCWKPFLLFLLVTAATILVWMLWVSCSKHVSFRKLAKKLWPSFLVALRTSSVDAAYGENVLCCVKHLGISKTVTSYGLPLGLVIYMPSSTMATMIFTMYAAKSYGIVISAIWCITAVYLIVALLVATPPVTGIGLLAYSTVFSQLGIPSDGLIIALLADILFGFVTAAANQVMLQMELVLQADRMGELNHDLLER